MNEMSEIRAEVEFEAHIAGLNPGTWLQFKELFKKGIRNRIGIGLCLMMYAPPPPSSAPCQAWFLIAG